MTVAHTKRLAVSAVALVVAVLAVLLTPGTADAASKKYKVRIDSAPQGATVYIDSKNSAPVGVTPWAGSLSKGKHTIIIELTGYLPATKSITVARTRKLQEHFLPLVKKSDPPRIDVRADADPNAFGAAVALDGQPMGQVPILLTTDPGRHQIEITKEGFEPFKQWVEVKEDEKVLVNPFMKAIAKPKLGTIVVEADVADAEVLVDGNVVGRTPVVLQDQLEGLHVVEVRKEPALPWKQTIQVIANQQVKVRAELKATLGGQGGSIRVLSNVTNAHVFLDGIDMGAVPVDIKDVKAGEHVIEVRAAGYQTREERVTVNAGSATVLKLDLNAEAKTEAKIKVVSPVPGADVYIDGALAGKVPVEQNVGAGEHFVVVQLEGYKKFEEKLRVEAGQTQTVSAELKAVGKLIILSDPPGATVLLNGLPQEQKTPLELKELEVGDWVVRVEMEGRSPQESTKQILGGESETMSVKLELIGMSDAELEAQQRGLSSFGARTLPRGRSTIDLGIGYPYFGEIRVNVGAGKIKNFGFDAGVSVRSFGARSELGLGARFMLVDNDPFTAGVFTDIWWGSKLLDSSKRNGVTWNAGGVASLTALTRVTVTGRAYLNVWSDRHCPGVSGDAGSYAFETDSEPTGSCAEYLTYVNTNVATDNTGRMEDLTGETGTGMFGRENGARLMTSIVAEISIQQQWNLWFMLEGSPFQGERALYTDPFAAPMLTDDYGTYGRTGVTYKF